MSKFKIKILEACKLRKTADNMIIDTERPSGRYVAFLFKRVMFFWWKTITSSELTNMPYSQQVIDWQEKYNISDENVIFFPREKKYCSVAYKNETKLLETENVIKNHILDNRGRATYFNFIYGYENGYLKLCCFGGTAFKIKCKEEDVPKIILPISLNNMSEPDVVGYVRSLDNWEYWDYYTECLSKELVAVPV